MRTDRARPPFRPELYLPGACSSLANQSAAELPDSQPQRSGRLAAAALRSWDVLQTYRARPQQYPGLQHPRARHPGPYSRECPIAIGLSARSCRTFQTAV